MKKLIMLIALAASLCIPAAFGQAINENNVNTPSNLYITSMYKVQVYLNNRVVDVLPGSARKNRPDQRQLDLHRVQPGEQDLRGLDQAIALRSSRRPTLPGHLAGAVSNLIPNAPPSK